MIAADEFDALFDSFRSTVYRLEALPAYDVGDVGAEAEALRAFHSGEPLPERSVHTLPWLARVARSSVVDGKRWARTRVVSEPLTDYERWEIGTYVEGQAVGERVRIAQRRDVGEVGPDFWLFDADLPDPVAVVMDYDAAGRWLGAEKLTVHAAIADLIAVRDRVDAAAVSLNEFVAGRRG